VGAASYHAPVPQGIEMDHAFRPGDLGRLIEIHGLQNFKDYGFDEKHEAYCARIAVDFILDRDPKRSRAWLARKDGKVVGSVFICERESNAAQLRLLFVDDSARGVGLGRWLVQDAVHYCREAGFGSIFLWTVRGLDRARSVYESLGFRITEEVEQEDWGRKSLEVRYEVDLCGGRSL
jgi:GNAT superfamily N-acetyltransferase